MESPSVQGEPRDKRGHHHQKKHVLLVTVVSSVLILLALAASSSSSSFLRRSTTTTFRRTQAVAASSSALSSPSNDDPKLAWLLSFPSSGTTYTLSVVAALSRCATATNYGSVVNVYDGGSNGNDYTFVPRRGDGDSVPLSPLRPHGPFLFERNLPLPPADSYVLTKAHCTGFCFDCPPAAYTVTPTLFFHRCASATSHSSSSTRDDARQEYDHHRVKKIVHLLRNPFDNIVSRFHHQYKLEHRSSSYNDNDNNQHFVTTSLPYSQDGFLRWCGRADAAFRALDARYYDDATLRLLDDVPCHAEFVKYVRWHNAAFRVADELSLPALVVRYEQYDAPPADVDRTVRQLLAFLALPLPEGGTTATTTPPTFQAISYTDYYTPAMRHSVRTLFQHMASEETWDHLQAYLPPSTEDAS